MKRLLLSILFFSILNVNGQISISGHISNNKNKFLYGAIITLKNIYDGATTDSLGNYSFTTTEKVTKY